MERALGCTVALSPSLCGRELLVNQKYATTPTLKDRILSTMTSHQIHGSRLLLALMIDRSSIAYLRSFSIMGNRMLSITAISGRFQNENKGAVGVDELTVSEIKDHLKRHWPRIRARLLAGAYWPTAMHTPSRLCLSDIRHRVPCKYRASTFCAASPRDAASIRFLFVRPALCLQLPSDSQSPATPLP